MSDDILDCVIYLYPSVFAAEQGESAGGSGFLVGVPSEVHEDIWYIYAVTNSHVIREGESPIVRLNTQSGEKDIVPLEEHNWLHHPNGDDVAACPFGLSPERHRFKFVGRNMFLTHEIVQQFQVGPGDDVFLVGRFITHEGRQRNLPSVRFGNIAMMPWEPLEHPRGILQESFLVEMRSIGGYSGSPVFVHIPPLVQRPGFSGLRTASYGPWLLGVDWGHIHAYEWVRDKGGNRLPDDWKVRANSGMSGVVPAWKLDELLNARELVTLRQEMDRRLTEEKEKEEGGVTLDTERFTPEGFEDTRDNYE